MCISVPQTPENATFTRTSLGWVMTGIGVFTSETCLVLDVNCIAFILVIKLVLIIVFLLRNL